MESTLPRKEARERIHRRAQSAASTTASTTYPTMTSKITSAYSHLRATTPSFAPHTHRYHHSHCEETSGIRQLLRLPLESSRELRQPMTPVSSLLLEKLQQERRAESERLASKLGSDLGSSTGDSRDGDGLGSSRKYRSLVEQPPTSSPADDSSQSSMGAKQAEKTVSTLHKQNFDLKLELYHRREKQSSLEARVEELEADRLEWQSTRDKLFGEMVKRDKAIEEAVNMIVKLEATIDSLVQERTMLAHFDTNGPCQPPWPIIPDSLHAETPKQGDHGDFLSIGSNNTLERMPSFLSERSIHTATLRNIVLQNRSNFLRPRKISDQVSSSSADVSEINRVASPSLSLLSESSFVSIYGSKQDGNGLGLLPLEDVSGIDGTSIDRSRSPTEKTSVDSLSSHATTIPSHMADMTPRPMINSSSQVIPPDNVVHHDATLSKMDKLGDQVTTSESVMFKTFTTSREKGVVTPTPKVPRSPSKWGKRDGDWVNRSIRDGPVNVHVLPPTPDTVSSSILRKHKDSPDSRDGLSRPDEACIPRFQAASPPPDIGRFRSSAQREMHLRMQTPMESPGRGPSLSGIHGNPVPSDLGQLAHSTERPAAAGRHHSDTFDSDSDSEGGADAHSDAESFDYWMRESYKPDDDSTRPSTRQPGDGSPSPDLFSFPVGSGGWEPEAMFGALRGAGFLGTPVPSLKRDPMDEIATLRQSSQPVPLNPVHGPQLPSRKSSLNAHNPQAAGNSSHAVGFGEGSSRDHSDVRVDGERGNSIDGLGNMASFGIRPDAGTSTKRSQYPPISGLQLRGRGLGLNSFLRRSGSESYGPRSDAPEPAFISSVFHNRAPSPPQTHVPYFRRHAGRASVPPPATVPWVPRPVHPAEDNNASATPPPILRNRPPPQQTDFVSPNVAPLETSPAMEAALRPASRSTAAESPSSGSQTTPVAPQSGGGVRKWLGLGKRASLMNRTK